MWGDSCKLLITNWSKPVKSCGCLMDRSGSSTPSLIHSLPVRGAMAEGEQKQPQWETWGRAATWGGEGRHHLHKILGTALHFSSAAKYFPLPSRWVQVSPPRAPEGIASAPLRWERVQRHSLSLIYLAQTKAYVGFGLMLCSRVSSSPGTPLAQGPSLHCLCRGYQAKETFLGDLRSPLPGTFPR